jgi:hypothetical protein
MLSGVDMKVLIYIEAHPIRERCESFGFVAQKFTDMLRREYQRVAGGLESPDVRILMSRYYSNIRDKNPDMAPAFLSLTREENDQIGSMKKKWNEESGAISDWVSLMEGRGPVSDFYESIFDRVHNTVFDFDVAVNWSTNGALSKFCDVNGLDYVAMEMGCLRSPIMDSLYFDAFGVNGNSTTRHLSSSFLDRFDNTEALDVIPFRNKTGKAFDSVLNPLSSGLVEEIYEDIDRNLLIPLQLKDDSNCILFSKYSSMQEFLREVIPPLKESGYRIFVKPHPAAAHRDINKVDHDSCREYVEEFHEEVFWLDDIVQSEDYPSLLKKMPHVVTVNSSTGFEAMLMGQLVVILGGAPFDVGDNPLNFENLCSKDFNINEYLEYSSKVSNLIVNHYLTPMGVGFEFDCFIDGVRRAVDLKKAYETGGEVALVDALVSNPTIDKYKLNRMQAKRIINNRFLSAKKSSVQEKSMVVKPKTVVTAQPGLAVVHGENKKAAERTSNISDSGPYDHSTVSNFRRKARKLLRDPVGFFKDSKYIRFSGVMSMMSKRRSG